MIIIKNKSPANIIPDFNLDHTLVYRDVVISKAEEVFGIKFSELDCEIKTFTTKSGFKFFTFISGPTPQKVFSDFCYEVYEVDFSPPDVLYIN